MKENGEKAYLFLPSYRGIKPIENGEICEEGNENRKEITDVHITIKLSDYNVYPTANENVYKNQKMLNTL